MTDNLVGVGEIAEMAGVSRQRAGQLTEKGSFPPPLVRLRMGPVWERDAVVQWLLLNRDGEVHEVIPVTFRWDTKFGECYECGHPAGFIADLYRVGQSIPKVDMAEPTIWEKLCAVCAANAAADGHVILRLFIQDHEDPINPAILAKIMEA